MSQFQDAREDERTTSVGHKLFIISTWVFPFLLAAAAFLIGTFYEPASALKTSTQTWPIPDSVYLWLLIFVLITATWLLTEFLSVTNRETVIAALQLDVMISFLTALLFTAFGGWLIAQSPWNGGISCPGRQLSPIT